MAAVQPATPAHKPTTQRRKFTPPVISTQPQESDIYTDDELIARVKQEFEPLKSVKFYRDMNFQYSMTNEKDDRWLLELSRDETAKGQCMNYKQTFRIVNDQTIHRVEQQIIEARLKFFE